MTTTKKVYQIGQRFVFDNERFFIYEGEVVNTYTKVFKVVCNICKQSDFPEVKRCMEEGLFKSPLPQVHYSLKSGNLPCGCSKKEGRRLFLDWTWEALTLDSEAFVKDILSPHLESGRLKRYLYQGKLHNSCDKEA